MRVQRVGVSFFAIIGIDVIPYGNCYGYEDKDYPNYKKNLEDNNVWQ